jgi:hypothetical protein
MAKLHVVAAMGTIDVVVFDDPSAIRTFVALPRDPVEKRRRQSDHQQTDYCLPHWI